MSTTFPGESLEYRAARNRPLEQEIKLRRAMEAVAAAKARATAAGRCAARAAHPDTHSLLEAQRQGGAWRVPGSSGAASR